MEVLVGPAVPLPAPYYVLVYCGIWPPSSVSRSLGFPRDSFRMLGARTALTRVFPQRKLAYAIRENLS